MTKRETILSVVAVSLFGVNAGLTGNITAAVYLITILALLGGGDYRERLIKAQRKNIELKDEYIDTLEKSIIRRMR